MLAFAAFLTLFRLEAGGLPVRAGAGLGPAAALAGLSVGLAGGGRIGRRRRIAVAAALVLFWTGWAGLGPLGAPLLPAGLGFVGFVLLGLTLAAAATVAPALVSAGVAAGALACAAGTMEALGLGPAVGGVAFLAAVGSFCRRQCPVVLPGEADRGGERLLLSAALGVTAAALLRAYLPAARSLAFGGADLTVAGALGYLVGMGVMRREATATGGLPAAALACLGVSLLCGFAWFLYPDLAFSEPALLQTPARLLAPGRAFPVYLLALALGVAAGVIARGPAGLMAVAAGAACTGLLAASARAPYVLTAGLIAVAALSLCIGPGRGRSLRAATLALAVAGVAFAALADPWQNWRPLRELLADQPGGAAAVVETQRLDGSGLHTTWALPGGGAEFMNGNLVALPASGEGASESAKLALAAALAFGEAGSPLGVVEPALTSSLGLARAAGGPAGGPVRVAPGEGWARVGALVVGPGPLSASGDPLVPLSMERLDGLRERLAPGGAVAICLPAGRMEVETLRRALAGVHDAFPDCAVFTHGGDAVVLAGEELRTGHDALARAVARLPDGAAWHPLDLVAAFTVDREHIRLLAREARPFRLSHPARPVRMARDLSAPPAPAPLAALVQYRQLGPARALDMVEFADPAARAVATRGFDSAYVDRTRHQLHTIGRLDGPDAPALRAFLEGPAVQWGLFAPRGEPAPVRTASAWAAFGRYESAAQVLRDALSVEPQDVATLLALAGLYAGPLGQPEAAAAVAARVLSLEPDNPAAARLRALARPR